MIVVSKKLKYLFDSTPKAIEHDDNLGNVLKDKTFYLMYRNNIIPKDFFNVKDGDEEKHMIVPPSLLRTGNENEDWDLIHLDGNYKNCKIDNLEPVLFVDEDPVDELIEEIENLEKELISKNEHIKKITFESKVKDGKVANMKEQVLYEQKRIKELNKELKKQDKEIRRLLDIINSKGRM